MLLVLLLIGVVIGLPIVAIVMASRTKSKIELLHTRIRIMELELRHLGENVQPRQTASIADESATMVLSDEPVPRIDRASDLAAVHFHDETESFEVPIEEATPLESLAEEPAAIVEPEDWDDSREADSRVTASQWSGLESSIGRKWITWLGVLTIFVGAGFFIKWAVEHGLLAPEGRVVIGGLLGLTMVVLGERFNRKSMRALGQGLTGGGLAVLYTSLWAAHSLYDLISVVPALGLMTLITGAGIFLSVWRDAYSTVIISCLGGLLTPVLLWTDFTHRDWLFSYVLLIDVGVLAVALFKRWHLLDKIAFIGTWTYFAVWYWSSSRAGDTFAGTVWLLAIFALFFILPFTNNLRRRTKIEGASFALAMSNAVTAVVHGFAILGSAYHETLGVIIACMSGAYLAMGAIASKRIPEDSKSKFGFIALSLTLLSMSIPVLFDLNAATIGFAIEAVTLLFLGYKYESHLARVFGFGSLTIAVARVLFFWSGYQSGPGAFVPIANPDFATGLLVSAAGFAFVIIHKLHKPQATSLDKALGPVAFVGTAYFTLVLCSLELFKWAQLSSQLYAFQSTLPMLWALGSAFLFLCGFKLRLGYVRRTGYTVLFWALVMAAVNYLHAYSGLPLWLNLRFAMATLMVSSLFVYASLLKKHGSAVDANEKKLVHILLGGGVFLGTLLLHWELALRCALWSAPFMVRQLLPVLWAGGAIAYLFIGLREHNRPLRTLAAPMLLIGATLNLYSFAAAVPATVLFFNGRFAAAMIITLGIGFNGYMLRRRRTLCAAPEQRWAKVLYGTFLALLFLYLSIETYNYFEHTRTILNSELLAQAALSVLWSAYAASILILGFVKRVRAIRLAGLALFGITAAKLAFVDLARLDEGYRIVSFIVLGTLLIGASYLYHRFEDAWAGSDN